MSRRSSYTHNTDFLPVFLQSCAQLYARTAASWRATKLCPGTFCDAHGNFFLSKTREGNWWFLQDREQDLLPVFPSIQYVMGVAPTCSCSLSLEAPQPLHKGHGSSTFLLIAGDKRWQKRCSSSSVFPKCNPEIFSWCSWLKKLQQLNLQHHQTSAPRGADNSLSNVISIDLKMRFAFAILCGIWSPLMSRNCSGWDVSSTAQLLTLEQVVSPGSFTVLCWNTGWHPWWMKDLLSVLTPHADCHSDNSWLHWYFTRPKPSTAPSRNSCLSHYRCFYNIPPSTDEKQGK